MKKPKLIKGWQRAWKLLSVQAMVIGTGISMQYGLMYDQMKEVIPPKWMAIITGIVFVLGIVGRVVSQSKEEE